MPHSPDVALSALPGAPASPDAHGEPAPPPSELEAALALTRARITAAQAWLGRYLSRERLSHSAGACEKAVELARLFALPDAVVEQAAMGALLHDCAKWMSPLELAQYCQAYGIETQAADMACPQTLHALVGAHLAEREFGESDPEVLNAIRSHTTGRSGMSVVEKLTFIADKIESNTRNPLFVRKTTECLDYRNVASLDVAALYLLDATIAFMLEKRQMIHPRAIEARNDLIAQLKELRDAHQTPQTERRNVRIDPANRHQRL
ncbi:MAG: bis(5'-nucleosyl)-tetraphosphatase (symmetrical) YqeK [Vampirovibrionales bacterium]|nr:bis(5'-nucleosyl)-tetraphosphatase (symmetrical) YqeK [Vampirovibrionales bacterium]